MDKKLPGSTDSEGISVREKHKRVKKTRKNQKKKKLGKFFKKRANSEVDLINLEVTLPYFETIAVNTMLNIEQPSGGKIIEAERLDSS